jgi:hypothetical protein
VLPGVIDWLVAMRVPGQNYSGVIIRLAAGDANG